MPGEVRSSRKIVFAGQFLGLIDAGITEDRNTFSVFISDDKIALKEGQRFLSLGIKDSAVMAAISIWATLEHAARQVSGKAHIWAWLAEKLDFAKSRPQAAPGIIVSKLNGRKGAYYILKNPRAKTYFRMSDKDYFLWQRMDGDQTVKELVVAYFMEYKTLALGRVSGLVEELKKKFFLVEQPLDVYGQVGAQLTRRAPQARFSRLWAGFIEKQFAIHGIDPWLTGVYNRLGWFFYTRVASILELLLSVSGLVCFFRLMTNSQYGVFTIGGNAVLGVISLVILYMVNIFIHEMSHALTVKHYQREVMRGGFMIYYGFPAFFIDTSDIWMEGKRARLAVTWAGPYSGLVVGGLLSLTMFFFPDFILNPLFFQLAFLSYIDVLFNLNPLLELDGYFLLMDGLEIPMLRRKSLEFIRNGIWLKFKVLRKSGVKLRGWFSEFSREERLFGVFGLLTSIWTAYTVFDALYIWQGRITSTATSIFQQSNLAGRVAILTLGGLLGLGLVIGLGFALVSLSRRAFTWMERAGFFATPWRKAFWAWGIVLVAGGSVGFYPPLFPFITLGTLTVACYFAIRNAHDYGGSRFARVFWLMSGAFLSFWLAEAGALVLSEASQAGFLSWTVYGMRVLASFLLVYTGLVLFSGVYLNKAGQVETLGLAFGLLASLAWIVVITITGHREAAQLETTFQNVSGVLSLATLLLMFPTLISFLHTSTGPAVITYGLGLMSLMGSALFGISPLWAYLFLTAGFGLQQAAYQKPVTLRSIRTENGSMQSDHDLLTQAFAWIAGGLGEQSLEIAGTRQIDILEEQFNQYALTAGWQVQVNRQQVIDALPAGWSLRQMGDTYAATLNLLLDLAVRQLGEKLTDRALQRVYDALPWEMREIAALYLFVDVKRAQAIGRQFQAVQQAYHSLLRRIPLFAMLSEDEIDRLSSRLQTEHISPGRTFIRQGDPGDKFCIVTRGSIEVEQRNKHGVSEIVNHLGRGDYFGQVALLNDTPRSATYRASVPTEVLSLSRADFNQLVKVCFDLQGKVESSIMRSALLRQVPLFTEMDSQELQLIAAHLTEEKAEAGDIIIRQGETGETFYVIVSGRVQVTVSTEDGERLLNEMGATQFFGEIALLLQRPRTATVRAVEPTRLLVLHKDDFDRLVVLQLYESRLLKQEMSRRMLRLGRAVQAQA